MQLSQLEKDSPTFETLAAMSLVINHPLLRLAAMATLVRGMFTTRAVRIVVVVAVTDVVGHLAKRHIDRKTR
jgi:hypothetical protein